MQRVRVLEGDIMTPTAAPIMPSTDAEWREACNLAFTYIRIDAARAYGLISGGPTIDVARCEHIIVEGKRRGIESDEASFRKLLQLILTGQEP